MPAGDRKLTMDELGRVAPSQYAARCAIRVVLDDVRSRHNVGSIFRTADSFGIRSIELCGFTPRPPHREIEKTALGATASVPWMHHAAIGACLRTLKDEGYAIIAVEQTMQAVEMSRLAVDPGKPLALVFGNELTGVSDEAIQLCDAAIVLPQYGAKHSLNVSVCAGIVLWWYSGMA